MDRKKALIIFGFSLLIIINYVTLQYYLQLDKRFERACRTLVEAFDISYRDTNRLIEKVIDNNDISYMINSYSKESDILGYIEYVYGKNIIRSTDMYITYKIPCYFNIDIKRNNRRQLTDNELTFLSAVLAERREKEEYFRELSSDCYSYKDIENLITKYIEFAKYLDAKLGSQIPENEQDR